MKNIELSEDRFNELLEQECFLHFLEDAGVSEWNKYKEAEQGFKKCMESQHTYKKEGAI